MLPTLIIRPTGSARHVPPSDHPDTHARLEAAWRGAQLAQSSVLEYFDFDGPGLSVDALAAVHSRSYLEELATRAPGFLPDGETWLGLDSFAAATHAAAVACLLAEQVANGRARNGIALTRPPGHHAHADRASGYCHLNNVVLCARTAQRLGLRKVLIVDLDAHHGDGTESLILDDASVALVSVHEVGLFPQATGGLDNVVAGSHRNVVNVPLAGGSGDADLAAAMDLVDSFASVFQPDLVLVSLGTDGHERDPMSSLTYSTAGIAWAVHRLRELSRVHCSERLGMILEGGYDYRSLTECLCACTQVLSGGDLELARPQGQPGQATEGVIEAILRRLSC